jgi:Flp pilus assembly protein TadD
MPTSTTPQALDRAWFLAQNNRFDRSEQELREYLSENPDDARAHIMLATILFDLSRHAEAIDSAKKAIELAPEHPYPYWVLGCLYIRLQQLDPAEEYLFEAIELDPECPDYYASLSELYWMRGYSRNLLTREKQEFSEKGVEAARTSLEIDPEHINAILFLVRNLFTFQDKHYIPEIIELTQKLLYLSPENAIAHEIYAQALMCENGRRKNQQDVNRILPILEESLRLAPNGSYSKELANQLLSSSFEVLLKGSWQIVFFLIMAIFALPLSVLTFYFYNTYGLQFNPTLISAFLTLVSLTLIIDLTQIQIRIWSKSQYHKFLQPNRWMYLFWGVLSGIIFAGFTWKILPVWLISILTVLLWAILLFSALSLFFIIIRSPWFMTIFRLVKLADNRINLAINSILNGIAYGFNFMGNSIESSVANTIEKSAFDKLVNARVCARVVALVIMLIPGFILFFIIVIMSIGLIVSLLRR